MKHFITLFALCACFTAPLHAESAVEKGVAFLRQAQQKNGSWSASPRSGIGPTTIILAGLLDTSAVKIDDPMIQGALQYLKSNVREDGAVCTPNGFFQNYETCCAVMCFAKANKLLPDKPYSDLLKKAEKYIRGHQFIESADPDFDTKPDDAKYGGVGYGNKSRPDLSNTQFFLDALKATGADEKDPAIQKALVFVSRCQNMESEHNTLPFLKDNAENLDGGFIYVNEPVDSRTETKEQSLRSYGAMTYAGLKSMVYAGVTKDDKRVKAAYEWIRKHYTFDENPGRGAAGLFYYYQTMAKSLNLLGETEFVDADGKKHQWRKELTEKLVSMQQEDGSWINKESRQYMENDPNLATGYALFVLAAAQEGGGNEQSK